MKQLESRNHLKSHGSRLQYLDSPVLCVAETASTNVFIFHMLVNNSG